MKKLKILLYPIAFIAVYLVCCVNLLANGFGDPALANKAISEPINILFIGFALIAIGSFLKRGSRRSE